MAEHPDSDDRLEDPDTEDSQEEGIEAEFEHEGGEETPHLELESTVDTRGACRRHITVTVAESDVKRYFDKEYSELVTEAHVPGFRPGRAPRKLIEARFRKDVASRVRGNLIMDAIGQVTEDEDLSPISEPDLDLEAVAVPGEGAFTFEFDLEVRPEFDVPQWRGLTLDKPVRDFSSQDVDLALERALARRGKLVPADGPAAMGDYISTNLRFEHDGKVLSHASEEVIRLRPVLSFRDGNIENFGEVMVGVRAGETRTAQALLSDAAPNVSLRGQAVTAVFEVLEVKKLELPELTLELLGELGGFANVGELRDAIRDMLEDQLAYQQRQRVREQITNALVATAAWDLPPDLLRRQASRELERALLELERSGFSEDEIRAHANVIRQNTLRSTSVALKEHFILEKIAEAEEIEPTEEDYEREIHMIALRQNQSVRRVRARLEKSGSLDVLHNQILERAVIERILSEATIREVPYVVESDRAAAVDQAAGGGEESEIPEAKPGGGEPSAEFH